MNYLNSKPPDKAQIGSFIRSVMHLYPDPAEHVMDLWKMIGYAAKYGNQPLSEVLGSSSALISAFNNGVMFWIEKENASINRG